MTINRVAVISDLHLDFWLRHADSSVTADGLLNYFIEKALALKPDLVVIAGDVSNGSYMNPIATVAELTDGVTLVFIPGNHDYYGHDFPKQVDSIDNDQLYAATLWSNFARSELYPPQMIFRQILDSRKIKGADANALTAICNTTFQQILAANAEIVVTHFPPSNKSINMEKYANDPTNPYFVNDFDRAIELNNLQTKLWICGHVHHKHDYYIGDMLVVCNPLGYPGELYSSLVDYQPQLVYRQDDQWVLG